MPVLSPAAPLPRTGGPGTALERGAHVATRDHDARIRGRVGYFVNSVRQVGVR